MRILVTGGAGYIGSFSCLAFRARGISVDVLDDLSTGHPEAIVEGATLRECNLLDVAAVNTVFRNTKYDGVVHFAAKSLVGESVSEPLKYYQNNVCGTLNLLGAAKEAEVGNFIFSSTAATYGNPVSELTEQHPLDPINPYGRSKLAVEQIFGDACAAYGLKCIALRYFNAAGAAEDGSLGEDHSPETHLIPLAITAALGQRAPLKVFGDDYETIDGTPVRDYVHVLDLAEAHVLALLSLDRRPDGYFQPMNVGTGQGNTVLQVLQAVESELKRPVPWSKADRRDGDPTMLVANADSIRATLGWLPRHSDLTSIIRTASEWHRKNPGGYAKSSR